MAYGTLKCDNIVFDNGGTDKLVTVSGLFFSTSGALTVTGTISGGNVTAPTATFTTLTGTTTAGTTATFTSGSFTSLTGVTTTVTSGVFGLGSAASPSIAFSGDTNNGIYSPGADQVAISTNGVGRLFVSSGGAVGIGTAPGSFGLLDVNSDSSAWGINLRGRSADNLGYIRFSSNSAATAYAAIGIPAINTLGFDVNGSERMRIDSSGRLGLGTSSPGTQLMAYGTNGTAISLNNASTGTTSTSGFQLQTGSGGDAYIWNYSNSFIALATNNTERARIDSSGRLLVGTSTARANFNNTGHSSLFQVEGASSDGGNTGRFVSHVWGSSSDADPYYIFARHRSDSIGGSTAVANGDKLGRCSFQGSDGSEFVPAAEIRAEVDGTPGADDMPGRLVFSTTEDGAANPTERMRITNTGKTFLSGTDSSFGQFQIGNTTSEGECSIAFIPGVTAFGTTPTSTNGDSRIWVMGPNVYTVGATQFAIGNKGVGNYVVKLASNTATSWTFSSDERLKNIEGPVVAATQIIEAINPVYYSFKADSAATRKVGLIAQNVLSVLPEVVDVPEEEQDAEGNQHYMGLAMTDIVPVLIAALKESNLKIKELTDRVAALEGN
jgi:hypothetical protein